MVEDEEDVGKVAVEVGVAVPPPLDELGRKKAAWELLAPECSWLVPGRRSLAEGLMPSFLRPAVTVEEAAEAADLAELGTFDGSARSLSRVL